MSARSTRTALGRRRFFQRLRCDMGAAVRRWTRRGGNRRCTPRMRRVPAKGWARRGQSVGCHLNNAKREHLRIHRRRDHMNGARALLPQPEKPAPLPAEPATPDDSHYPVHSVGRLAIFYTCYYQKRLASFPCGKDLELLGRSADASPLSTAQPISQLETNCRSPLLNSPASREIP